MMTFAQARQAFRLHKTCESADLYLEDTTALKTAKAIGEETFFNAVGEVANWLSASDECLRTFEVVKTKAAWRSTPNPKRRRESYCY
jgi:hypothetical protein